MTTITSLLWATVAIGCACCVPIAASADSIISSSSTGVPSPASNSTLLVDDGAESLSSRLPVSVAAAIGIVCACVVTLCMCLALCARSQMRVTRTGKSRAKATPGSSVTAIQAKIDAARRGWRKSDGGDGAAGGVVYSGGARSSQNQWETQLHVMSVLAGGGMGGLGACRYPHFGPEDFVDEPWATAANIESLRVSGCILDVVLAARESMALSALSGLIPLGILIALPFHEMLLEQLQLSDWYGPILSVEFDRCVTIASAALAVHVGAILLARRVYKYDRAPSIAAEKEAARLQKQTEAQRMAAVMPAAQPTPTGGTAAPSPFTMHTFMRSPTHPPSATFTATKGGGGGTDTAAAGADPAAVPGRDPSAWPLAIFCACALLSYALLGFQAYKSFDESLGRRYEVTATPRLVWPESAGHGPFITFVLCLIVGCVAIVPIAFSLKLLALFFPRQVHPHLLRKAE